MKTTLYIAAMLLLMTSCKKYLDLKSDKENVIPETLQDAQAMLDNYGSMNLTHMALPAQSDDDYYLTDAYYNSISEANQQTYPWLQNATSFNDWRLSYSTIIYANTALELVEKIETDAADIPVKNRIKGSALFYRGYTFLELVQIFAEPYDRNLATSQLGIPLRLTSSISEPIFRPSLQQTYDQIVNDLKLAVQLLPVANPPASRPSKPAAYAAMARCYMAMQDYPKAGLYADSCLQLYNTLIDYNTLSASSSAPFPRLNVEVIFQAIMSTTSILGVNNMRIDSVLYLSYEAKDLRKSLFFKSNGTNTFGFKGSYDGNIESRHFNGIAVDEVYLIRAEAAARAGNKDSAMNDLNRLLKTRWATGFFVNYTAANAVEALNKVLQERRKELVIRGLRWFDLRRLNKETQFEKTLYRKINNQLFQLLPNSPRYTFYIPTEVIAISGLQQNVR